MTVDVNVVQADEALLEDIDEVMEDTMVQMFILQPRTPEALEDAKEQAEEHTAIFYVAPLSLQEATDGNCVGFFVDSADALQSHEATKPLFVDESQLDEATISLLKEKQSGGIILNATQANDTLEQFFFSIGPGTIDAFDTEQLGALPMDRIVLQSGYPAHGFDTIHTTAKRISDVMFRPEQSIIANATRNALMLMGFKK